MVNVESAVKERYSAAARERDGALCCPVTYDQKFLKVIPQEIIERDYGCGDPSRYVRPGETVLDLGSGGGKMCFIVAQVVGPEGKVIGVDMNEEMLALARKHQEAVGRAIGWQNVQFHRGRIQDLALDWDKVDAELARSPVRSASEFFEVEHRFARLRHEQPMIATNSVDVVISNCVLNLVDPAAKNQLFNEIFRVLKVGGRAVISDIVATQPVPPHLRQDPEMWSGCISGALEETEFLQAFLNAGFDSSKVIERQTQPWRVVQDIEFRSVTVEAVKKTGSGPSAEISSSLFSFLPSSTLQKERKKPLDFGASTSCCGENSTCC